jgi:hypothetical protein
VWRCERQLTGVERKVERQHPQVDLRVLVSGEADVSDLALGFRAFERLDHAASCEMALRIVVVDALVNLPEIEMIGPEAPQRFVKLARRHPGVASVRAHLRHQEDRVPAIGDGPSHPALALSVVVLPGVVEEVDARVDRFVNNPHGLGDRLGFAEMKAAETDDGHAIG